MGKTTVLDVAGRVTIGHDAKLRDAITEAVDNGATNVLLNMSNVTRMDSSGVGELIAAHTSMKRMGGRLVLVDLSPKVAAVLQITHLLGVLELYDDAETALASLEEE